MCIVEIDISFFIEPLKLKHINLNFLFYFCHSCDHTVTVLSTHTAHTEENKNIIYNSSVFMGEQVARQKKCG